MQFVYIVVHDAGCSSPMTTYGSDRLVAALAELGVEHLALNPGATIRGLHDSLVNPDGPSPALIACLHEEIAVGVAHGYWKASGRPMAVGLHDTVGLLHGSMAIFNAWVDRAPMLIYVGTGPLDSSQRRPWIDWVHTVGEQGELVRPFTVWNDQPLSLASLISSTRRAWRAAMSHPRGPAVIGLDVLLQEADSSGSEGGLLSPDVLAISRPAPDPNLVEQVLERLHAARRPAIITDRSIGTAGSTNLVALAEKAGAALIDLEGGVAFPVGHAHDVTEAASEALRLADLLLFIDVRDPGWALGTIDLQDRRMSGEGSQAQAVSIGLAELTDRSWMVTESDQPARLTIVADPELAMIALNDGWGMQRRPLDEAFASLAVRPAPTPEVSSGGAVSRSVLIQGVADAVRDHDPVITKGILTGGWMRRAFRYRSGDQFLGRSGGEGLGYALPASVGAGLALKGSDRMVVALQGDGDLMYVPQALWTAAHHQVPLLIVVDANRRYDQDARHQVAVAKLRGRPLDNVGRGIDIVEPAIDLTGLARSLGIGAEGPVTRAAELPSILERAVRRVASGEPTLVEVVTL